MPNLSELDAVRARGPDFAFPMDEAPKDGSILRLLVKFDRKSAAGAFEDTSDPSWTIGTNNMANTGEDQWDVVGWSWEQDVFCQAYGATVLGWLPFHPDDEEMKQPRALPPPSLVNAAPELLERSRALLALLDDYMVITSLTANDRWATACADLRAAISKALGEPHA